MNQEERQPVEPDAETPEIPDFRLIRKIGSGGFGSVWLAENKATGHIRAVKLIPLRGSGASRELMSFTRLEARARHRSRDLLPIHHVGKTEQNLFFVMDLADDISGGAATGEAGYEPATLDERLQREQLSPEESLDYARQLLGGLASLHEAGMVHRDVKPANCLFVGGELKLADFGLLTDTGPDVSRLGTVKYMPPDGRMDTRADVYAAGLVIYEMLTGLPVDRFPSLGPRAQEIVADPVRCTLVRLSLRACSTKRDERYPDARHMADALGRLATDVPLKRRVWWPVAAGAFFVVLSGSLASLLFLPGRTPDRVDVNFVTQPHFNAVVYLDGDPVLRADATPYRTPCTIEGLPARAHRVEFRLEGHPRLDAGSFDFEGTRQITAWWPGEESP